MININELRNLQLERYSTMEMVALLATAELLETAAETNSVDVPEWLTDSIEALSREVTLRRRDEMRRQLKAAEARYESLKAPEEKRESVAAEIERLRSELENE